MKIHNAERNFKNPRNVAVNFDHTTVIAPSNTEQRHIGLYVNTTKSYSQLLMVRMPIKW